MLTGQREGGERFFFFKYKTSREIMKVPLKLQGVQTQRYAVVGEGT